MDEGEFPILYWVQGADRRLEGALSRRCVPTRCRGCVSLVLVPLRPASCNPSANLRGGVLRAGPAAGTLKCALLTPLPDRLPESGFP